MTLQSKLRIGTRGSPLALAQAHEVEARLIAAGVSAPIEIVVIKTTGDKVLDRSLAEIGGKGLFTKEIDEALLDGRIDLAVHSMKDMPTALPEGIALTAVLEREDVRDVFLSARAPSLAALPEGAVVGTASLRRGAQILRARPDLLVRPLRGNVQTRLAKLKEGGIDATILALAGLRRLGMAKVATEILPVETMLPAVAQGAIGITTRSDDAETSGLISGLDHAPSRQAVTAERAFLAVLDGSCRTPIAAHAGIAGDTLRLDTLVLSPDGAIAVTATASGAATDAPAVGQRAGAEALSRLPAGFLATLAGRTG